MARHWVKGLGTERLVAAGLLLALLALRVWDPVPIEYLRLKSFDLMQIARPRAVPPRSPAVIVDIDEKSLAAHGQWPWPRAMIADLVTRLQAAGVRAIAFDVLFAEPDRLSGPLLAAALAGIDADTRAALEKLPTGEATLAAAMRASKVVAGAAGYNAPTSTSATTAKAPAVSVLGSRIEPYLPSYPGLIRSRPEIEAAAAGIGLLTVKPDRDGLVRRAPTLLLAEGKVLPALDVELIRIGADASNLIAKADAAGIRSVVVAQRELTTDLEGQVWINFSRHDASRFVSAGDVLTGKADPARLAGRFVLIGSSAVALFDLRATALDSVMPGVEIHAQTIENILDNTWLSRPNYAIGAELVITLIGGALLIATVPVLAALPTLLIAAVSGGGLILAAALLFTQARSLLDVSFPLLAMGAVLMVLSFFNYWHEETRRTQIRAAFSQYVSPALVERLAREPDRLKLGGESREMTILFSDVRGFTTISEAYRSDPQGLVTLMNGLLTPLTNAVLGRRGTIDKYMGDALLAFWNAPLDDERHPAHACLAALDMIARLKALNATRREAAEREGRPFLPIDIGIGINTGTCVVGNMGSDLRFDYSVLGDSVNIASRLESLTKSYGVSILVGSKTAAAVRDDVTVIAIDRIRVKGKTEPETIFAVLGPAALAAEPWLRDFAPPFAKLREAYAAARWREALGLIDQCRDRAAPAGLVKVVDLYADRLRELAALPAPPAQWDGVYSFASKEG